MVTNEGMMPATKEGRTKRVNVRLNDREYAQIEKLRVKNDLDNLSDVVRWMLKQQAKRNVERN